MKDFSEMIMVSESKDFVASLSDSFVSFVGQEVQACLSSRD